MTRTVPVLLSLALLPLSSLAQETEDSAAPEGFNAHYVHMAAFDGDLRDTLVMQRPGRMTQWDWFLGGMVEYANAPLVRYETNAAGETFSNPILDHVVALHVSGGVTFHERFRLDLTFPVFLASFDGNQEYQGVDMGEIRLSGLVSILAPDDDEQGLGLGVVGHMDLPTGATREFLGDRTVSGGGSVVGTYGVKGFTASLAAGLTFRPSIGFGNLMGPDTFSGGLGVGYLVHETTSVNLEAKVDASFKKSTPAGVESPVEMLAVVRHRRPNGGHLVVGGSAGLVRAAGAARFRLFVGGGFGKIQVPPPKDMDMDGLVDEIDVCPEDPETVNGWKDEDGCPDELATLDMQAFYQGEVLRGSEMELTLGDSELSEKMISRDAPRRKDGLEPLQSVEARATFGSCLAGDAAMELEEGVNTLDIRLRPRRSGRVMYEITDLDGAPVPGAVATWKTTEEGCAEPTGYQLGADGTFEHPMGVGTHTVFVDAPGFRIHREEVTLDTGDTHLVKVQMQSTRVKVDRTAITILEKVYFETAKATIKPESFSLLDEVATVILATKLGRVRIEGHTDSVGNAEYNMDLSQRRADAVRSYLISKGLSGDDLIAVGYGEGQPVVSNASAAGRAQNRRVVFTLLDQVDQQIEINE
jgi:outer membrane protein OmpA-like peptidoglycan-associated protein